MPADVLERSTGCFVLDIPNQSECSCHHQHCYWNPEYECHGSYLLGRTGHHLWYARPEAKVPINGKPGTAGCPRSEAVFWALTWETIPPGPPRPTFIASL